MKTRCKNAEWRYERPKPLLSSNKIRRLVKTCIKADCRLFIATHSNENYQQGVQGSLKFFEENIFKSQRGANLRTAGVFAIGIVGQIWLVWSRVWQGWMCMGPPFFPSSTGYRETALSESNIACSYEEERIGLNHYETHTILSRTAVWIKFLHKTTINIHFLHLVQSGYLKFTLHVSLVPLFPFIALPASTSTRSTPTDLYQTHGHGSSVLQRQRRLSRGYCSWIQGRGADSDAIQQPDAVRDDRGCVECGVRPGPRHQPTSNCQKLTINQWTDFRLQLASTDYGNFLANEASPLATTTIAEKCTERLVAEFQYLRAHAVKPLSTFLDYISCALSFDSSLHGLATEVPPKGSPAMDPGSN